jgi:hypothetical protein
VWCNDPVPWCTECDRYLTPPVVRADGSCPACGRQVQRAALATAPRSSGTAAKAKDELPPVPWHFKAMLGALAVYLGYRFFEIGEWLVRRF